VRHAVRQAAFAVVLLAAMTVGASLHPDPLLGEPSATYHPISEEMLRPIEVASPTPAFVDHPEALVRRTAAPSASPSPKPTARPTPKPTAKPRATARPVAQPKPPRTTRSLRGLASWYCKAGVSPCHYRYPPGSMVAAACGKLRAAMGPNWRGRIVTVSSGGRQVTVRLVDWCGSKTKTIDLYWEPMRRLGGTGVLPVIIRW